MHGEILFNRQQYDLALADYKKLQAKATTAERRQLGAIGVLRCGALMHDDAEAINAATALLAEAMSMLELTPDFIKEFAAYLTAERGLKNATIWLNCMWLKGVVMRAHYNGLIPRNPFAQFHISPNVKEREYLTEDEIKRIMAHEFDNPTLVLVRDLFIFACFTALSFVDMKELTTDEIVEVNGEKWILSKRHKTNVPFQVKLLDIPLQIIERYKYLSEDKLVFGKINYWTMCKQLKKVMAECGIEKQISYHCARHTFGTLALSKGMPIESVSRVLGHTNIVTTQIYAKITTQKLDNDLTMFGNKLNASFGSVTP